MSAFEQFHFDLREKSIEICCGMARGADTLGEQLAIENQYKIRYFPANWKVYGKHAGPLRNEEMANYANYLIAFWDGFSKGTEHMLKLAHKKGLNTIVFRYQK